MGADKALRAMAKQNLVSSGVGGSSEGDEDAEESEDLDSENSTTSVTDHARDAARRGRERLASARDRVADRARSGLDTGEPIAGINGEGDPRR